MLTRPAQSLAQGPVEAPPHRLRCGLVDARKTEKDNGAGGQPAVLLHSHKMPMLAGTEAVGGGG